MGAVSALNWLDNYVSCSLYHSASQVGLRPFNTAGKHLSFAPISFRYSYCVSQRGAYSLTAPPGKAHPEASRRKQGRCRALPRAMPRAQARKTFVIFTKLFDSGRGAAEERLPRGDARLGASLE